MIGKMKTIELLVALLFSIICIADDSEQYLPDQLSESPIEKMNVEEQSGFIMDSVQDMESRKIPKDGGMSYAIPLESQDSLEKKVLTEKEKLLSLGQKPLGTYDTSSSYLETEDLKVFDRINDKGGSNFAFYYIKDDYEVKDRNNIFNRTFESESDSTRGGSLHLTWEEYFNKGSQRFFWSVGAGFGVNIGRGYFISGERSDATFKLWTLPVDAGVGGDIAVGQALRLSLSGGPTVMGLLQSRTDRGDGEKGKRRRQVGFGYYGAAKVKVSLSNIFSRKSFELFSEYDITNFFLNLEARHQNYDNFQDEIQISGTSFGLGFSFDYL